MYMPSGISGMYMREKAFGKNYREKDHHTIKGGELRKNPRARSSKLRVVEKI